MRPHQQVLQHHNDASRNPRQHVLQFLRSSAVFVLAVGLFFALRSLVFGVFEPHTILLMASMFLLPIIALSARRSESDTASQPPTGHAENGLSTTRLPSASVTS